MRASTCAALSLSLLLSGVGCSQPEAPSRKAANVAKAVSKADDGHATDKAVDRTKGEKPASPVPARPEKSAPGTGGKPKSASAKSPAEVAALMASFRKLEQEGKYREAAAAARAVQQAASAPQDAAWAEWAIEAARVRQFIGDYATARKLLTQVAEYAEAPTRTKSAAWLGLACIDTDRQVFPDALKHLTKCLELAPADDAALLVFAHGQVAYVMAKQGELVEARAALEKCRAAASQLKGDQVFEQGHARFINAYVAQMVGNLRDSEEEYRAALDLLERAAPADHPRVAACRIEYAAAMVGLGRYQEARTVCQRILDSAQTLTGEQSLLVAWSQNNLGAIASDLGEVAVADDWLRKALDTKTRLFGADNLDTSGTICNLGIVQLRKANLKGALELMERSVQIRERIAGADSVDTARLRVNRAYAYIASQDVAAGLGELSECVAIYEQKLGPQHFETATVRQMLNTVNSQLGQPVSPKASQDALAAIKASLGPEHPWTAIATYNLGLQFRKSKNFPSAAMHLRSAIASVDKIYSKLHADCARFRAELAHTCAMSGNLQDAAAAGDEAERMWQQYAATVLPGLSESEQTRLLNERSLRAFNAASFAWAQRKDPASIKMAIAWQANAKAAGFEALSANAERLRGAQDPQLRGEYEKLAKTRERLAALLAAPPREGVAAYLAEVEKLRREQDTLYGTVALRAGKQSTEWVTFEQIQAAIPEGALFIDIARLPLSQFKGESEVPVHYVAFVVPQTGEPQVINLGAVTLVDLIVSQCYEAVHQNLGAAEFEPFVRAIAAVTWKMLEPAVKPHNPERLILSPDGILWVAPWAALPMADKRPLVEQYEITTIGSARSLVQKAPASQNLGPPLIVADPDYDLAPGRPPRPDKMGRLPGTAREADMAAKALAAKGQPVVLRAGDALESKVRAAERPAVLVLSTHGYFLPGGVDKLSPLSRCGLALTGANAYGVDAQEDGLLTGVEVLRMNLVGTELVILSACHTGTGQISVGEGVSGLRQAFALAGARNIVAATWAVPDAPTAQLMETFYDELSRSVRPSQALRAAQRKMLASPAESPARHPVSWAAFSVHARNVE